MLGRLEHARMFFLDINEDVLVSGSNFCVNFLI